MMKGKIAWLLWEEEGDIPVILFAKPAWWAGHKLMQIVYFEVE